MRVGSERICAAWVPMLSATLALWACADPGGASVSFTLGAEGVEACAARCVAWLRLEVVGDPAHAVAGPCDAPQRLDDLPVDVPLAFRVTALDADGHPRFVGTSAPALTVAGDEITLTVPLESTMAITAVEPPPPWLDAPTVRRVVIRGQGFGARGAASVVHLGSSALTVREGGWSADAITAEVQPTDLDGPLSVTTCGTTTPAYPIAAAHVRFEATTVAVPGCGGATLRAAAPQGPNPLLQAAFACASGDTVLGPLDLDKAALGAGPTVHLTPMSVAVGNQQNRIILAGKSAVWIFKSDLATDRVVKPTPGWTLEGLATYAGFHTAAVVTGPGGDESALWTLHGAGWEPLELRLPGVAFTAVDGPYALARDGDGARLFALAVPEADPVDGGLDASSVIGASWALAGCETPVALAVARSWSAASGIWKFGSEVAVLCGATGAEPARVVGFSAAGDGTALPITPLPGLTSPTAMSLDRAAEVAWVWSPTEGTLIAVHLASGAIKGRWDDLDVAPADTPLVRAPGLDRFVVARAGAGALTEVLVTPAPP